MKDLRLKRFAVSIFVALSLAVSSFAAPLCACLNVAAKTHDCCEKMKDHCPMKRLKGASVDKAPHSGCACFAEKRETIPTKISDNGNSQTAVPVLLPSSHLFELTVPSESGHVFFPDHTFTENLFLKQISVRGPPRL